MSADGLSLQEQYAPHGLCFGCGVENPQGLHIRSFVEGDDVVATWHAKPWHTAWEGVLGGGVAGALLDCHSNWTAAWHLMQKRGADHVPNTVTAEYHVKLLRPAPINGPITLRARPSHVGNNSATIEATLEAGGEVCATCHGTFVAVKEGHPAFGRW